MPILPDGDVVNCGTLNFSQFFDSPLYCVNEKLGEWKMVVHGQYSLRVVVLAQQGKLCDIVVQLSKLQTYVFDSASIDLFLAVPKAGRTKTVRTSEDKLDHGTIPMPTFATKPGTTSSKIR